MFLERKTKMTLTRETRTVAECMGLFKFWGWNLFPCLFIYCHFSLKLKTAPECQACKQGEQNWKQGSKTVREEPVLFYCWSAHNGFYQVLFFIFLLCRLLWLQMIELMIVFSVQKDYSQQASGQEKALQQFRFNSVLINLTYVFLAHIN